VLFKTVGQCGLEDVDLPAELDDDRDLGAGDRGERVGDRRSGLQMLGPQTRLDLGSLGIEVALAAAAA
jgi:hypothetical protein